MSTITESLIDPFRRLALARVLVLGDLILDRYTWGNTTRISPEAPVPVLEADRDEVRLGGAAGVAYLARNLEAVVAVAGLVGDDPAGRTLGGLFDAAGIDHRLVLSDPGRPTTSKTRFVGRAGGRHPHQILRVDREVRDRLSAEREKQLLDAIAGRLGEFQAVLVSDYDKGVCSPGLLRQVIAAATRRGLPVAVDPARVADHARYRGATLLTPNRQEAQRATGRTIDGSRAALAAGRQLCETCRADAVLVTLDREGIAVVGPRLADAIIPTRTRTVYDVTGAGDMVLAVVGMGLAVGVAPPVAARLANVAAGLEVERLGAAPVFRHEIEAELAGRRTDARQVIVSLEAMARLSETYRRRGKTVVLANGCFDLLHAGHAAHLEEAARLGDVLVVAVNGDRSVRRLKGSPRPIIGQQQRAAMLAALRAVDHVVIFDADTPHALLGQIRPDVLVKGGTYDREEVVGGEVVERYGGEVRLTGKLDGVSTSRIVAVLGRGGPK